MMVLLTANLYFGDSEVEEVSEMSALRIAWIMSLFQVWVELWE